MQHGGQPKKIILTVDLTKYHPDCKVGSTGKTIPNHKCGLYGSFDHFVAVKFDNGAVLDVAYNSLEMVEDEQSK